MLYSNRKAIANHIQCTVTLIMNPLEVDVNTKTIREWISGSPFRIDAPELFGLKTIFYEVAKPFHIKCSGRF
jgi:hypothetical protein